MIKEKVTKRDLEKFEVGDQKVFVMPNFNKARSAASYAHQQKNQTGRVFRAIVSPFVEGVEQRTVTITRLK